MTITIEPNGTTVIQESGGPRTVAKYEVKTYVGDTSGTLLYSNSSVVNGTGGSGSSIVLADETGNAVVRLQSHWDSGVKYRNFKISDPPS